MALIKLGSLAQDVRGSQNGLTFSRNKGGAYVRQKVSPVQPNTPSQRAVRQAFAINSKLWSGTMTAAERAAWVAYATTYPYVNVFGDSSVLTGIAMSMAKNQVLNQIGGGSLLTPPVDNSVTGITNPVSMIANHTGTVLTVTTSSSQSAPADTSYYVFATPSLPAGRNPGESIYRFIGVYAPAALATTILLGPNWATKFGAMQVGNVVYAVIAQVSISKGNITVGTKLKATVT